MIRSVSEYFRPSKLEFEFQKKYNEDARKLECKKIEAKYPGRCPIVCEILKRDASKIELTKHKYLVPNDITIGQFVYVIRKRINLSPEQAMFLFLENKTLPMVSSTIGKVASESKKEDGFLYLGVGLENTFG